MNQISKWIIKFIGRFYLGLFNKRFLENGRSLKFVFPKHYEKVYHWYYNKVYKDGEVI